MEEPETTTENAMDERPPIFGPIIHLHTPEAPRGDAISQALESAGEFLKPDVITVEAPDGTLALAYVDADGFHLVPDKDLDQYRDNPRHRSGNAVMLDLNSFIAHVIRHAKPSTVIFADNNRAAPKLTAVIDYNGEGADGQARFGRHRTKHDFPLSDEWKAWNKANAEPMKMVEFARFLEDHIIDVLPAGLVNVTEATGRYIDILGGRDKIADPGRLMDIANNLSINEASIVKQVNNLSSGETQVEFQNEHNDSAGQKIKLPTMFVVGIPVFNGGQGYQIIARLRYRKNGPEIVFWYELWRTDLVFDDAFDGAVERVRVETSQPVLIGHPEV
jgi:uncharacterized protein YfdQ (DUF2303 family)